MARFPRLSFITVVLVSMFYPLPEIRHQKSPYPFALVLLYVNQFVRQPGSVFEQGIGTGSINVNRPPPYQCNGTASHPPTSQSCNRGISFHVNRLFHLMLFHNISIPIKQCTPFQCLIFFGASREENAETHKSQVPVPQHRPG